MLSCLFRLLSGLGKNLNSSFQFTHKWVLFEEFQGMRQLEGWKFANPTAPLHWESPLDSRLLFKDLVSGTGDVDAIPSPRHVSREFGLYEGFDGSS